MAMTEPSPQLDKFTSQLSAKIWGHRFKDGQRGPEYALEFLNVLFGANYSFSEASYAKKSSVGLRKFIFEGVKEGSSTNSREILVLEEWEKQKLVQAVHENDIPVLKQFLRNLEVVLYNTTGKEADRSWFARSLYPLHESLLYVELRKKGKSLSVERNFFARGGELYYLMLAHGTDKHPNRRHFIETRFKELLTKNKVIEKVVTKISSAFEDHPQKDNLNGLLRTDDPDENVPALPETSPQENEQLFAAFAEELEQLLLLDLEIYEIFHLLTPLVCFQLTRYMHERARVDSESLWYFFDCLEGNNKQLSQLSSTIFDYHENLIKNKFEMEFEQRYQEAMGDHDQIEHLLPSWKEHPDTFLDRVGLGQLKSRKGIIIQALKRCANLQDVLGKLKSTVREVVSEQLKQHQLKITRVLTRDGGFATYRRGSAANYRYTISDSFLQMLVFTKVRPKQKMEYYEFLQVLFRDYGIVIGENQAKQADLYESSRLNVRYFQDNEKALREKLRHNGLLIEFSDATAMIQNPYSSPAEVSYA